MKIIKASNSFCDEERPFVFLAGSIEMGVAENWQDIISDKLKLYRGTILNPRRDDWNSSWIQSIENEQFRQQVEWELNGLEAADFIVMYFDITTKSPITLLELGLFCRRLNLIVCCPSGFWRHGNVEIVCKKYGAIFCENKENLMEILVDSIINFAK